MCTLKDWKDLAQIDYFMQMRFWKNEVLDGLCIGSFIFLSIIIFQQKKVPWSKKKKKIRSALEI